MWYSTSPLCTISCSSCLRRGMDQTFTKYTIIILVSNSLSSLLLWGKHTFLFSPRAPSLSFSTLIIKIYGKDCNVFLVRTHVKWSPNISSKFINLNSKQLRCLTTLLTRLPFDYSLQMWFNSETCHLHHMETCLGTLIASPMKSQFQQTQLFCPSDYTPWCSSHQNQNHFVFSSVK